MQTSIGEHGVKVCTLSDRRPRIGKGHEMKRNFTTVWQFLKKALRHSWILISGGGWSLFGTLTRIRDNFLPEPSKQNLGTRHLIESIPRMSWQEWLIGILILFLGAIVRSALLQIRDVESAHFNAQEELARLREAPLSIEMVIHQMICRPSFETHAFWNRDIFLWVSADLVSPRSVEVKYELAAILSGKTVMAGWLRDVDSWCRTEIVRNPNPFSPSEDKPWYIIDELNPRLEMGQKIDGWLHFRTVGLPDGEFGKCKLRLLAKSEYGASYIDMPEGSFQVIPGNWKIVAKNDAKQYSERSPSNALPPPV